MEWISIGLAQEEVEYIITDGDSYRVGLLRDINNDDKFIWIDCENNKPIVDFLPIRCSYIE